MKVLKKIGIFFIVMAMSLGISNVAYAATENHSIGDIVDGSTLTDYSESEVTVTNPMKGNILNQGTAKITDKGNGVVNVYGAVFGSVVCDKLILDMTLQRLQNGTWVDVKYFSDTAYNTGYLTNSYNTSVTKGYYYRVKAACVAQKGSTSESKMPVTDGIWID